MTEATQDPTSPRESDKAAFLREVDGLADQVSSRIGRELTSQEKTYLAALVLTNRAAAEPGGSQDGDHECNGRRPAPEPPPPGDLTR